MTNNDQINSNSILTTDDMYILRSVFRKYNEKKIAIDIGMCDIENNVLQQITNYNTAGRMFVIIREIEAMLNETDRSEFNEVNAYRALMEINDLFTEYFQKIKNKQKG